MLGKISRAHTFSFHLRRTPNNLCESNANDNRKNHRKFENEKTRHQHTRTNFHPVRRSWVCVCVDRQCICGRVFCVAENSYRDAERCSPECAKRTTRNIENPPLRINTAEEHELYCAAQILSELCSVFTEQATHSHTHTRCQARSSHTNGENWMLRVDVPNGNSWPTTFDNRLQCSAQRDADLKHV